MKHAEEIKGTWTGAYAYDGPLSSRGATGFRVDIAVVEHKRFSGTVQDDEQTGGMPGQGHITGELDGGFVWFKKYMPHGSMLMPDGRSQETGKKHAVIHYRGEYFPLEKKMRGTWKIKPRLFFAKGRLVITRKNTGTWAMTME